MRNNKYFWDVTLSNGCTAWLNEKEIEAIIRLSNNETTIIMKSGHKYIIDFNIDDIAEKFDLDLYSKKQNI
nr:MAG TPA: Flagellar and Swarming motility protein [Caudoviricetes sp.]